MQACLIAVYRFLAPQTRLGLPAGLAALALGCALMGCGRVGFEAGPQALLGPPSPSERDATVSPSHDGEDGGTSLPDDVEPPLASPEPEPVPEPPDGGPTSPPGDGGQSDEDAAAEPRSGDAGPAVVDEGCTASHPRRVWPSAADTSTCSDQSATTFPTTGVGAADWTLFGGCPTLIEVEVTPDAELRVYTFGDGCRCPGCSLWHLRYALQEDDGAGFTTRHETFVPDDVQCPNGEESSDETFYRPTTSRVRMQTLAGYTGAGFYYAICSE